MNSRFAEKTSNQGSVIAFRLLVALIFILWLAGGSARADAAGQLVVRAAAWLLLISHIFTVRRIEWQSIRPIAQFLLVAGALVSVQLIPLPPEIWTALPSRTVLESSATVASLSQPWRPLSISPSLTVNALGSLIVPFVVLLLGASLSLSQHGRILVALLYTVLAGCVLGLLQLAGAALDNPLINEMRGLVSGNLANRNHLALFISLGIVLVFTWGFKGSETAKWKLPVVLTLIPFFLMILFATGSRTGLVLAAVACVAGLLIARSGLARQLKGLPGNQALGLAAAFVAATTVSVILALRFGRAEAVDRLALDAGGDMRFQALPVVVKMIAQYFPWGSGFGTFDPAFRIVEPDGLLRRTYFNHAHSDWLEVAIEGGFAGVALALAALTWWAVKSVPLWLRDGRDRSLARAGSAMLLLIAIASVTDYPARTPLVMSLAALGAVWMSLAPGQGGRQSRKPGP